MRKNAIALNKSSLLLGLALSIFLLIIVGLAKSLSSDKHFSLLGPFIIQRKLSVVNMTPGSVFTTFNFSPELTIGCNKLECCIIPGLKGLSTTNTVAYWAHP